MLLTLIVNHLIESLPQKQRLLFLADCTCVPFQVGDALTDSRALMTHVHFPLSGFITQVLSVRDHPPLAIGIIGNDGMLGANFALGLKTTPLNAVIQSTGFALRMTIHDFGQQLRSSSELTQAFNGYVHLTIEQLSQTVACNRFHGVLARLARWLLMIDDCSQGEAVCLTQSHLADMLGVRRSAVTIAAGQLQQQNIIGYSRGQIRVLSRPALENIACECYAAGIKSRRNLLIKRSASTATASRVRVE